MSEHTANPGYAQYQLAKALLTAANHEDEATRTRASHRIDDWSRTFLNMMSGMLHIGTRTPVANTPAWVTLRVIGGGFATGEYLAGGELQPHEVEMLRRLPSFPGRERALLNGHYLSETGLQELRGMLLSGKYRINVPEEGALLVVAWLLENGHYEQARNVVDQIAPFMDRLRFYPVPAEQPEVSGSNVHLLNVGQMVQELRALKTRPQRDRYREAVTVWVPLYDEVVWLFLETVEEDWPCQKYPDGWAQRAAQFLARYDELRRTHRLCKKPDQPGHNFSLLRGFLRQAMRSPRSLSGRDVGLIRKILIDIKTKRGLPGSEKCAAVRRMQADHLQPSVAETAKVVVQRLSALPQDQGLDSLDAVNGSITAGEAGRFNVQVGTQLPGPLCEKLQRCVNAPLAELVAAGIITSAEVLAKVVPQVTAQVEAASIADSQLRRVYASMYRAFRRRRSLMLFNLEQQVRITELPWVDVLNQFRRPLGEDAVAQQTLTEVVALALTAWPEQILPNKLIQEIRALAKSSGLKLPITEELATDIFMGEFSQKFVEAARISAHLLQGSLYERYYRLPFQRVLAIEEPKPEPVQPRRQFGFLYGGYGSGRSGSNGGTEVFAALCYELAGVAERGYSYKPARNGKVVEQQQLLTTHNLAPLFAALGLQETLGERLEQMPRDCFTFVLRSQLQKVDDWKSQLQAVKNQAYAWRQMVFFLSVLPPAAAQDFVVWADQQLVKQGGDSERTLRPLLEGLVLALAGITLSAVPAGETTPHRFLGWTTERHWLLGPKS